MLKEAPGFIIAPRRVSEWSGDHEPSELRLKSLHAKCSDASVGAVAENVGGCGGPGVAGGEVCADALVHSLFSKPGRSTSLK